MRNRDTEGADGHEELVRVWRSGQKSRRKNEKLRGECISRRTIVPMLLRGKVRRRWKGSDWI